MIPDYLQNIKVIFQLKERNIFQKYIEFIRFPYYRNMEIDSCIHFDFPLTVIIGQNGCGKSSLLHAIYGMPQRYTPYRFWFDTKVDPIEYYNDERKRHSFWYQYRENGMLRQVVKARIKREDNPNYWETSRPLSWAGMSVQERHSPIVKNVVYLDFRAELSAFDKYFYFGNTHHTKARNKQEFIRRKSSYLKKALSDRSYIARGPYGNEFNKPAEHLSEIELDAVSYILGRKYTDAVSVFHSFFRNEGYSVLFRTKHAEYSEAFAGSGEMAVVRLVREIVKAPEYSLILLDEPEVSLHPGAQERLTNFLLEQIKGKKHQVIVTSHSPSIIKHLPSQSIKALYQNPETGRFFVKENLLPEEAFFHIEVSLDNKKRIHFEDILAREIVDRVLESMGQERAQLFNLDYNPGGCSAINTVYIPVYCRDRQSKEFIFFDGDQYFAEPADWRNLAHKDLTEIKLKELVFKQTNCNIVPSVDGQGGKGKTDQKIDFYKKYLDYYKSHVFYMPGQIPEDIIWDEDYALRILPVQSGDTEYQSIVANINACRDSKCKFEQLAFVLYGEDKINSTTIFDLQKIFINNWIRKNDENYKVIAAAIDKMASWNEADIQ